MSPRKANSNSSISSTAQHQQPNSKNVGNPQQPHVSNMDQQMKSRQCISNSMHIAAPDEGSGGGSSDEDSDNINVDKLKTIRNKAAQR